MNRLQNIREYCATFWRDTCMPWYAERTEQEQRLLISAAVILPLIIIVFGLFLPMQDRVAALQQRLPVAAEQAVQAERLAASLKQGNRTVLQGSLLSNIERMSNQSAVRTFMTHIRPETSGKGTEKLSLQFRDVPYSKFIAFAYRLAEQGISIASIRVQAGSVSGKVHVQMQVSR